MNYLFLLNIGLSFMALPQALDEKKLRAIWAELERRGVIEWIEIIVLCIVIFEVTRQLIKLKYFLLKPSVRHLPGDQIVELKKALVKGDLELIKNFVNARRGSERWIFEFADKDFPANVTLLFLAVAYNKMEIVKFLISKGADVNVRGGINEMTPLELAIINKNIELTELLVSCNAQYRLKTFNEAIPPEIITLLADSRKKPTYADIFDAVEKCSILGVKACLRQGIDVNATDAHGQTPLHICAIKGCSEIAKLLIAKGADINLKDAVGNTALKIAVYYGNKDVEAALRFHGAEEQ